MEPKLSKRKKIINIGVEINKMEHRETAKKSVNPKAGPLRTSIKLLNLRPNGSGGEKSKDTISGMKM